MSHVVVKRRSERGGSDGGASTNQGRTVKKLNDDGVLSWLFAVPGLLILGIFVIYPFLNTIRLSFTNARMLTPGTFVGLQNYVNLFKDSRFATAFLNSSLYVICVVPFMIILPLILASLVTGNSRVIGFFRTTYYFPVVLSAVVVGLIWTNLLDSRGLINSVFQYLHVISKPIPFLTDRWLTLFSAMFVTMWLGLGYYMIIYISALANIDNSLYEAAAIDGAGPIRQFIHVTIPGVKSTMLLIMLLSSVAAFRVFNEIYVLTNGTGGVGGKDVTVTMMIQQEGTGLSARTGYASAISVVLLIIVGIITVVQLLVQRRGGKDA
ncbi:ABC transporter permease [Alloscardovia macacae]|uniref:ABC transporter permease n=1 Tax=Alloscardovia macacae TaxID=1160091 RepID=A0A1Y2SW91_9BIFI|nr:sugar ABC transporter permease [Alloscardovia macacae]OTA27587.1 ABC transporter permease [Alloscardovia macacae]OTA30233.1 ABC transporter permease [Alloscardovia macacae]